MTGPANPPRGPGVRAPATPARDRGKTLLKADGPGAKEVGDALEKSGQGGRQGPPSEGPPAEAPRALLGQERLLPSLFSSFSTMMAAEHLMLLLAKGRGRRPRAELLAEAADLLLCHERPEQPRKIALALADAGRIVDIYPLEVLAYCVEQRPELFDGIGFADLVLNKEQLEQGVFGIEDAIRIELPLAAKLKAMALEGGGSPGYHLYPGGLAEYFIELGDSGRWSILLRAEVHKEQLLDRVVLQVAPEKS